MNTGKLGYLVLAASLGFVDATQAGIVTGGATASTSTSAFARARNGNSGFEGLLSTPGGNPNMNPVGAPVWMFGSNYNFNFTFTMATGVSLFQIDFNRDGDYLDASESVTTTSPTLVNRAFNRVGLYLQSSTSATNGATVTMSSLAINGYSFGPYSSAYTGGAAGSALNEYFSDSSGSFGDIVATGSFSFSQQGPSQEQPKFEVQLGDAPVVTIPLPPAAWAGLGSLAGVAGFGMIRRRKNAAL